jgi:zinc and cadmium transporter
MDLNISAIWLLVGYGLAVICGSLIGGWLPRWIHITHTRLQLSISFVGGLMIGIAIFHMLPHALHGLGGDRINELCFAVILGMMVMFFLLRFFHFHQHVSDEDCEPYEHDCSHDHDHSHDHDCSSHDHDHSTHDHEHDIPVGSLSWVGLLLGLGVHTFLDGVALASTVQVEVGHGHGSLGLAGFGVFLAVLLHKPLDSMSLATLMRAQGASGLQTSLVNFGYACLVPIGAACVVLLGNPSTPWGQSIAAWCLGFSCGVFLCIALSDLLPEMEFHSHHRWMLSAALILGTTVAWAVGFLEPDHLHHVNSEGNHRSRDHEAIPADDHSSGSSQKPSIQQLIDAVRREVSTEIESDESIGNLGFSRLHGLDKLEILTLLNASMTDEAAETLQTLTGLKRLRIEKAKLGDRSAKAISGLGRLELINLPDVEFSDAAVSRWDKLSKLFLLRIGSPKLTDHCLETLSAMPSLRFLHLIDIPITDAGLVHLAKLSKLESFYLDGGKATDEGLSKLLKQLPELHFHRDQQHLLGDPLTDNHGS